jgi:Tfp pilus assembly protein PilV
MPNTTNNNWPTPADTDLVKNGADAIRDLGNAIDTTLGVYSPVTSGLVKINTTSFSGVTVQTVSNVFTSTYQNYRVYITWTMASGAALNMRFAASGTPESAANYYFSGISTVFSSDTISSRRGNGTTGFSTSTNMATSENFMVIDVASPQTSANSKANFQVASSGGYGEMFNGVYSGSTSFDGISFNSSVNITGTIRVYGLAN